MSLPLEITKSKAFTRLFLLFLGFLYVLLLHIAYVDIIAQKWSYLGYLYNNPPLIIIALAWFTAIIPLLWLPIGLIRPSQFVYWFLYLVVVVPTSIIPSYLFTSVYALATISWPILLSFALIGLIYRFPLMRFPRVRVHPAMFRMVVWLIILLSYGYFLSHFSLNLQLPSLISDEIYRRRLEARETITEAGGIFGYVVAWIGQVINPFLISLGLTSGYWLLGLLGVFGQLLVYSAEATKSTLLSPLMLMGLFILVRKKEARFGLRIIAVAGSIVAFCLLSDTAFAPDISPLTSILVRRMIITPGLLTSYYFEFFSENPKAELGHSILRGLVDYPYSAAPPFVIGVHYFNNPATSANANFFADAFANFGYPGIFLFGLILALILWLFDCLSRSLSLRLAILMLAIPGFALSESALLTSLLTHGIFGVLVLTWLLPRELGMKSEW